MSHSGVDADSARVASDRTNSAKTGDDMADLARLDGFLGFHLRLAQDASFRAFSARTGLLDLRPGRFAAMIVIRNNPGITPIALSRAIVRDKSTVTPLVQDLERRNLVRRARSAVDRRSVQLTLTEEGEAMLDALLEHANEHDRRLDEIVGEEKPQLLRLLRKIADALP